MPSPSLQANAIDLSSIVPTKFAEDEKGDFGVSGVLRDRGLTRLQGLDGGSG